MHIFFNKKLLIIIVSLLLTFNSYNYLFKHAKADFDSNDLNKKFDSLTKKYGAWLLVEIINKKIKHNCDMAIFGDLNNDTIPEIACYGYPSGNSNLSYGDIFQIDINKRVLSLVYSGGMEIDDSDSYSNGWKILTDSSSYCEPYGKSVNQRCRHYFQHLKYYSKYCYVDEYNFYNEGNYEIEKKKNVKREYDSTGKLLSEEEIIKTIKNYKLANNKKEN